MALKGTDSIGLVAWFRDLSYAEVHSFIWGAGFAGGATVAWVLGVQSVALLLAVTYLTVLVRAVLGIKLESVIGSDLTVLPEKRALRLPKYVIRQVRQEVHYYIGGGIAGPGGVIVVDTVVALL